MARQAARGRGQNVPAGEDREQVARNVEGMRGADLPDQASTRLLVGLGLVEHRADACGHLILEWPDQLVANGGAVVAQSVGDRAGKSIAHIRQHVAADPIPERLQRAARKSSG